MLRTRPIALIAVALLAAPACGDGDTASTSSDPVPTDGSAEAGSDPSRNAVAKGSGTPSSSVGSGDDECPPSKASCTAGPARTTTGTRDRNVPTGAAVPTQPPSTLAPPPPAPTAAPTPTFDVGGSAGGASQDDSGGPPTAVSEQVFTDYLLAAGAGRFEEAWGLLTSGYQSEYGGFENFVDFWSGIALVGINSISAGPGEGETILDVVLFYETLDGVRQNERVQVSVIDQGQGPRIADYFFIELVD